MAELQSELQHAGVSVSVSASPSDDSNSDSDSDGDSPLLSIQDGLSLESLLALQHFQAHGYFEDDKGGDAESEAIPQDTICVSYTPQDSKVIAETYRRLQLAAEASSKQNQDALEQRLIQDLVEPNIMMSVSSLTDSVQSQSRAELAANVLRDDGVVRINHVLSNDLADECLQAINTALTEPDSTKDQADSQGFGNVFSRRCRYDMYLRPVGIYGQVLDALLSADSVMGPMFRNHLLHPNGQPGIFHEFSALVCDPTADSQPIHPDASYCDDHLVPMWTVFVALQDVELDMGATVFLPGTHQAHVHADLNSADPDAKNGMLASAEYRRSTLKAGDVAIMDARTLHFGSANTSDKRRVLLYFTIRNPAHGDTDADFPGCGSLYTDLHMTTTDFW
jgi:ectoine hydroxylase-related dioxygenase (phytanoyl-CoA dioxygenase family)